MLATDGLVREFHEHPGSEQPVEDFPVLPSRALVRHRWRLIEEEFKEVAAELDALLGGGLTQDEALQRMRNLLKEMCDLRYVLDGTAVSMGLDYEGAYRETHASNMTKVWPDGRFHVDPRGKVIKPPSYRPADMAKFVPQIIDIPEEDIHAVIS